MQNPKYNKLIATLQEIFMLDHAELDFGIYRIMNQKRNDIEQFLQKELIPQVKNILTANVENEVKAKQTELENKIKSVLADDEDPDTNKKVIALRADIEQAATNLDNEENDVFSALTKFFSRYYEGGDFVSKRRYKNEATYVVPYNGEEVKLHWANADQYYIKTSEFFRKYQFKINETQRIVFELLEAETEQNNNKTAADKVRRFAIAADVAPLAHSLTAIEWLVIGLQPARL
jgi:adenine-specific DNA-methyltransferase